MVGFYSDAQVLNYPCKVTADEDNSLGDPHAHMTIDHHHSQGRRDRQD